ncbi:MAG: AAA family ATPase [Thermomicrobiales bacterium]
MGKPLQEVLVRLLDENGMDVARLAASTGVPRKTLDRWAKHGPSRVHLWQALVKIARALNLDRAATNELLEAGGKPTLDNLISLTLDEADRALLDRWVRPATGTRIHHLTSPLTSFVGRQEDVTRIANLLANPAVRFVTLTGPGGSGKTRLALEVVHSMRANTTEICFVDLSSIRHPDMVIPAITEALDLKEALDASPVEALADDLRNREVLLVLDNFEQVTRGALPVVRVLEKCPTINVLATSRTRLRVRGEHEYAVPPLTLPAPSDSFDVLQSNPAVTLFVDRAKAADSSFELTAQNAPLVAEICIRVDGLPLGIELAAARTRRMRPAAILERFHGGLAMADGGPRDVPERQRTLQATIAWSYDLLDEVDRRIFAFMGTFLGGFTLEAATSVLSATGLAECPVMSGVERLVDDSLITQVSREDDDPRYEMLETIREFATERLAAS